MTGRSGDALPKAIARFKHRVRALTGRHRGITLERMIRELVPYLRGWAGYFGFSQWRELASLDGWIDGDCDASFGSSGRRAAGDTGNFAASRSPNGWPVRLSSARRDPGGGAPWKLHRAFTKARFARLGLLSMEKLVDA